MSTLKNRSGYIKICSNNNKNNDNLLNSINSTHDLKSFDWHRKVSLQNNEIFRNSWADLSKLASDVNDLNINTPSKVINKSNNNEYNMSKNDYSVNWEADMDLTNCCASSYLKTPNLKGQNNCITSELENMDLTNCCNSSQLLTHEYTTEKNISKNPKIENMDLTNCYDTNNFDFWKPLSLKEENDVSSLKVESMDLTHCFNSSEFLNNKQTFLHKYSKIEHINLNHCSISNNSKLKSHAEDSFLFNSHDFANVTEFEIEYPRESYTSRKMHLNGAVEELRKQYSYQKSSEISKFLNGLTESTNLSHLSDDSVFHRLNDTSYINNRFENATCRSNSIKSKLENKSFLQILKNLVLRIILALKRFLWWN